LRPNAHEVYTPSVHMRSNRWVPSTSNKHGKGLAISSMRLGAASLR
jgi:hypothetical protein